MQQGKYNFINEVHLAGDIIKVGQQASSQRGRRYLFFTLSVPRRGRGSRLRRDSISCVVWEEKIDSFADKIKQDARVEIKGNINTYSRQTPEGEYTSAYSISVRELKEVPQVKEDKEKLAEGAEKSTSWEKGKKKEEDFWDKFSSEE